MTHTRQELGARRVRSNDHFDRHGSKNTMATCASAGKKITTSATTAKGLESDAYSNLFDEVQSSAAFNSKVFARWRGSSSKQAIGGNTMDVALEGAVVDIGAVIVCLTI